MHMTRNYQDIQSKTPVHSLGVKKGFNFNANIYCITWGKVNQTLGPVFCSGQPTDLNRTVLRTVLLTLKGHYEHEAR